MAEKGLGRRFDRSVLRRLPYGMMIIMGFLKFMIYKIKKDLRVSFINGQLNLV
jgi:hypothetical protein